MKPAWWTQNDHQAVTSYEHFEKMWNDFPSPDEWKGDEEDYDQAIESFCSGPIDRHLKANQESWKCRRCRYWQSKDGNSGNCSGPELALGFTEAGSECEQWEPRRITEQREQEVFDFGD